MDMGGIGCPGWKGQVRAELLSFSERSAILNDTFLAQLTRFGGCDVQHADEAHSVVHLGWI
jgi:hypothetical protein